MSTRPARRLRIQNQAERKNRDQHHGDSQCVADRYRNERQKHNVLAVPMQTERDRKQPTHGRIDAMEESKPGQGQPGSELGGGVAHGSSAISPPLAGERAAASASRP